MEKSLSIKASWSKRSSPNASETRHPELLLFALDILRIIHWLLLGLLKFCSLHHLIAPLPDSPYHPQPSLCPPTPSPFGVVAGNLACLLPDLGQLANPGPLLLCHWLCLLLLDWASWSAPAGLLCGWFRDAPGSSVYVHQQEGQPCHVSGLPACQYFFIELGLIAHFQYYKWLNLPKGDYTKKGATLETSFFNSDFCHLKKWQIFVSLNIPKSHLSFFLIMNI